MDRVYLVWLTALGFGALLGLFLRIRTVGILVAIALGICAFGFAWAAVTRHETAIWMSGMALIALPILGTLLVAGAALSGFMVASLRHSVGVSERRGRDLASRLPGAGHTLPVASARLGMPTELTSSERTPNP